MSLTQHSQRNQSEEHDGDERSGQVSARYPKIRIPSRIPVPSVTPGGRAAAAGVAETRRPSKVVLGPARGGSTRRSGR
eukprot:754187-Hanusia_phi.AAC.6